MKALLSKLQSDYPAVIFEEGRTFYWSPKKQIVYFSTTISDNNTAVWSLLHELSHAVLKHLTYQSDFELLQLEIAAWQKAEELANKYSYQIDSDHIQDCLDTYRDWLYQRSTCPTCTSCSLQVDSRTYQCFNCSTTWRVSSSRLCRAYRQKQATAVPA